MADDNLNAMLKGLNILVSGGTSIYGSNLQARERDLDKKQRQTELTEEREYQTGIRQQEIDRQREIREENRKHQLAIKSLNHYLDKIPKLETEIDGYIEDFQKKDIAIAELKDLPTYETTGEGLSIAGKNLEQLSETVKVLEANKKILKDQALDMAKNLTYQANVFQSELSKYDRDRNFVLTGNEFAQFKKDNAELGEKYGWSGANKVYKDTFGSVIEADKKALEFRQDVEEKAFENIDDSYKVLQKKLSVTDEQSLKKISKDLQISEADIKALQSVFSVPDAGQLMSNLLYLDKGEGRFVNLLKSNPVLFTNFKNIEDNLAVLNQDYYGKETTEDPVIALNKELTDKEGLISSERQDYLNALTSVNRFKTEEDIKNLSAIANKKYGGNLFKEDEEVVGGRVAFSPEPNSLVEGIKNWANQDPIAPVPTYLYEEEQQPEIDFTSIRTPTAVEALGDYVNILNEASAYEDSVARAEMDSTALANSFKEDEEFTGYGVGPKLNEALTKLKSDSLIEADAKRDQEFLDMFTLDPRFQDLSFYLDTVRSNPEFAEWARRNQVSLSQWDNQ